MRNGKRVHKSIPNSVKEDEAKEAECREKSLLKSEPADKRIVAASKFKDFFELIYLPSIKNKKKSYEHDKFRGEYLIEYFGDLKLRQIKALTVEDYIENRSKLKSKRGRIYSSASINREIQLLSTVFSPALRNDLVDYNPVGRIKLLSEENNRERYLSKTEEVALLEALRVKYPYLKPIVTVALHTGLRRHELLTLKFGQCNLTERDKFFYFEGKDREIPPGCLLVKRKGKKERKRRRQTHFRSVEYRSQNGNCDPLAARRK